VMDRRLIEAEAKLTPLQHQLLSLIGEGKTDHQIARALNINEAITKAYTDEVMPSPPGPPMTLGNIRSLGVLRA